MKTLGNITADLLAQYWRQEKARRGFDRPAPSELLRGLGDKTLYTGSDNAPKLIHVPSGIPARIAIVGSELVGSNGSDLKTPGVLAVVVVERLRALEGFDGSGLIPTDCMITGRKYGTATLTRLSCPLSLPPSAESWPYIPSQTFLGAVELKRPKPRIKDAGSRYADHGGYVSARLPASARHWGDGGRAESELR